LSAPRRSGSTASSTSPCSAHQCPPWALARPEIAPPRGHPAPPRRSIGPRTPPTLARTSYELELLAPDTEQDRRSRTNPAPILPQGALPPSMLESSVVLTLRTTTDSLPSLDAAPPFAAVACAQMPTSPPATSTTPPTPPRLKRRLRPQTRTRGSGDFHHRNAPRRTASTRHHCTKDRPTSTPTRTRGVKRFNFTGREWDGASGMYYYRARWYQPGVGRFASADPLPTAFVRQLRPDVQVPFPQEMSESRYAYVLGNPINRIDPLGLYSCGTGFSDCIATCDTIQIGCVGAAASGALWCGKVNPVILAAAIAFCNSQWAFCRSGCFYQWYSHCGSK